MKPRIESWQPTGAHAGPSSARRRDVTDEMVGMSGLSTHGACRLNGKWMPFDCTM